MGEEYKGYLIVIASNKGGLREIKAKGKGSVVKALRGLYTSSKDAKSAIDKHIINRQGKNNAKPTRTS